MAIALVARAYCSLLGIVYPLLNTISWYNSIRQYRSEQFSILHLNQIPESGRSIIFLEEGTAA